MKNYLAKKTFGFYLSVIACAMMFGASWSAGVFWALPAEIYPSRELVSATAFCSGASNIPNPIAPAVVGGLLGTRGYWGAGWMTCCAVSILSVLAALYIAFRRPRAGENYSRTDITSVI